MKLLSVIVPCHNEAPVLPIFYEEMKRIETELSELAFEYVFVDDGSTDDTLNRLKEYAKADENVRYISFSRNFGKEAAMLAGLEYSAGDYVTIMDADLQDPPSLLPKMYHMLLDEGLDCVGTKRTNRKGEPKIRSFFADLFYKVYNHFSDVSIINGARDFRLMTREMVQNIVALKEKNRFSKGLFAWVGFQTKTIAYENVERAAGKTKWSFWKLVLYSLEGLLSFSTAPLTLISFLGFGSCVLSFILIVDFVFQKLLRKIEVTGYAAMICIILFLGGIQLLSIGVLGQYLARVFTETKARPSYIIREESKNDNSLV